MMVEHFCLSVVIAFSALFSMCNMPLQKLHRASLIDHNLYINLTFFNFYDELHAFQVAFFAQFQWVKF